MKYVAPVIIVILIVLYWVSIFVTIVFFNIPPLFIIIGGFILVSLLSALIYILVQRIREIKEEEKDDDLSKY